jgi:hypothetical protein
MFKILDSDKLVIDDNHLKKERKEKCHNLRESTQDAFPYPGEFLMQQVVQVGGEALR